MSNKAKNAQARAKTALATAQAIERRGQNADQAYWRAWRLQQIANSAKGGSR